MAIKRIVDTSFWTDGKVDEFTPEDKYFMLYLLTNPFTTQLGIYKISIKTGAFQMGYSEDAFKALIERFENKYGIIIYSKETDLSGEIAIKNFLIHSIIKGGAPVRDCLIKEIKKVKNKSLVARVFAHIKDSEELNDTVKNIIAEYEEKNGSLNYTNKKYNNKNENENENDVSYPVSYHDTYNDTSNVSFDIQIMNLFNSLCPSYSPAMALSEEMKANIQISLQKYGVDGFKAVFEKAEVSDFLKGSDGWKATFDWLIKEDNIAKVLNGNYDNKQKKMDEVEKAIFENLKNEAQTQRIEDDPELKAEAEALKKELAAKY